MMNYLTFDIMEIGTKSLVTIDYDFIHFINSYAITILLTRVFYTMSVLMHS